MCENWIFVINAGIKIMVLRVLNACVYIFFTPKILFENKAQYKNISVINATLNHFHCQLQLEFLVREGVPARRRGQIWPATRQPADGEAIRCLIRLKIFDNAGRPANLPRRHPWHRFYFSIAEKSGAHARHWRPAGLNHAASRIRAGTHSQSSHPRPGDKISGRGQWRACRPLQLDEVRFSLNPDCPRQCSVRRASVRIGPPS